MFSGSRFSRFLGLTLVMFQGISLAVVVGIFYGIVSRSMATEYDNKLDAEQAEISMALQDRLNFVEMRLRELTMNNSIRVSLMLGVRSQLRQIMDEQYAPSNGMFCVVRDEMMNPEFFPELPRDLLPLASFLKEMGKEDLLQSLRFHKTGVGRFLTIISLPIHRKTERLGAACVIYDLSKDERFLERLDTGSGGRLLILDGMTLVDLRTGEHRLLPSGARNPAERDVGRPLVDLFPEESVIPLEGFPGLYYAASSKPLHQKKTSLVVILVVLCGVIFGFTLVVSLLITRKVSAPLKIMADEALRIADEPRGLFLPEEKIQHIEFKKLAQAFNRVLNNLLEAQEQLKLRVQRELDASDKRYRGLLETSPTGIFSVDPEWNILFANRTLEEITGYSPEELCSMRYWELMDPGERSRVAALDENPLDRAVRELYETRWLCKGGRPIWVELRSTRIREMGVEAFLVNVMDVTERKRAEEERVLLATAVEQSTEHIIVTDRDRVIRYVNPAFEKDSGYSRNEIIGQKLGVLRSDQHDGAFYRVMRGVLDRGEVWRSQMVNRRKDGTYYEVEATISPIRAKSGGVVNFVAVGHDLTRERRLEKQLRQAHKMEAIGTLAGGIAHDFNNILAAIMGYTEMALGDAPQGSRLRQRLERMLKASQRAKDLVQQILTFSRQSEGDRKPVEVTPILKEALKLMRASLPATIEIRQNFEGGAASILADPTQIHQVIMNLCTNAAHAMREQGGVLELSLGEVDVDATTAARHLDLMPGQYVRLTVRDTGCGMDSATMERIFEPFFTTKEFGEGTGMGLAVVHGIVKYHGGTITVESTPGKGTTVHVFLPRIESEVLPQQVEFEPLPKGTESILFVDDERFLAEMIQEMLEDLGYMVTSRTSSIEALEAFRDRPDAFDLIITDQTMPNLTGAELAGKVLQIRPDIPIILCTGFSEVMTPEKARLLGIREFIMKPVVKRDMAVTIRRVLDGRPAGGQVRI